MRTLIFLVVMSITSARHANNANGSILCLYDGNHKGCSDYRAAFFNIKKYVSVDQVSSSGVVTSKTVFSKSLTRAARNMYLGGSDADVRIINRIISNYGHLERDPG